MKKTLIKDHQAFFSIFLASLLWFLIFRYKVVNFWFSLSMAATLLGLLAIFWGGLPFTKKDFNFRSMLRGAGSAVILYGIFWLGKILAQIMFDFALPQIASIYAQGSQGKALAVFLVLFFITSPCEEIFWRGFIGRWAIKKYGNLKGFLLGSTIYTVVHIVSGNFMLIMAALVAGLFWSYLYQQERNLVPLIISHALWTVAIFVLFPMI